MTKRKREDSQHEELYPRPPETPDSVNPGIIEAPKPKCFRIAGIPRAWSRTSLSDALRVVDPSLNSQDLNLSIFPACCGDGQVALCYLAPDAGVAEHVKRERDLRVAVTIGGLEGALTIDDHFHDLTQLNAPEGEIVADVVAVTGLAGHAFGSWRSRDTCKMWLKDFLPRDVRGIRVMSYGYNSNLIGDVIDDGFLDYRRHFINCLRNARRGAEGRPIVFIGHSMGGILILQALLQCKNGGQYKQLFDATKQVYFFGTPHRGMEVKDLQSLIKDEWSGGSRQNLVNQLEASSDFLMAQMEDIAGLWGTESVEIFSFYETKKTPSVQRSASGTWERGGEEVDMVAKNSVQLFWSFEHRIPVGCDHSNLVKFHSKEDPTYQTVVTSMVNLIDNLVQKSRAHTLILTKDQSDCLKSLKAFDCETYRDLLLFKRHENSCMWLFSDERYRRWAEKDEYPILWIHGSPGSGKSVLSSVLSKELCRNGSHSVVYFFCDSKDDRLRDARAVILNLLAQLLRQDPGVFRHFLREPEYQIHQGNTSWSQGMLWRVFERILRNEARPVRIIIDALDECDETREHFLDQLSRILQPSHDMSIRHSVKIVITSRPHTSIKLRFPNTLDIALDAQNQKDITNFATVEVSKLVQFPEDLRKEIRDTLINGANGMFLWVSLVLEDLRTTATTKPRVIRAKLKSLPKTLPELYTDILRNIKPEYRADANVTLQWVVWAVRPLTLRELAVAIAIQPEHDCMAALKDEVETDLSWFLQKAFGPLLRVNSDRTVHIIHQSAKDFLSERELTISYSCELSDFRFRLCSVESNIRIATSCLTYLSFDEFDSGPINGRYGRIKDILRKKYQGATFLGYAGAHWADHVAHSGRLPQEDPGLWNAFQKVATSGPKMNLAYQVFLFAQPHSPPGFRYTTSLQIAVYLRLATFVEKLIREVASPQASACSRALQIAARNGDEAIVRLLVDYGAEINFWGGPYGNALQAAAYNGNGAVVRFFVDRGANINTQGGPYGNALQAAARNGNEDVVRLLVDRGVDVNTQSGK